MNYFMANSMQQCPNYNSTPTRFGYLPLPSSGEHQYYVYKTDRALLSGLSTVNGKVYKITIGVNLMLNNDVWYYFYIVLNFIWYYKSTKGW
jgi:hypothetical protein